jgi:hypothetical protein
VCKKEYGNNGYRLKTTAYGGERRMVNSLSEDNSDKKKCQIIMNKTDQDIFMVLNSIEIMINPTCFW